MSYQTTSLRLLIVLALFSTANCSGIDNVQVSREGSGTLPARMPEDSASTLPALFSMKVATDEEGSQVNPDQIDRLYLDELILESESERRGDDFGLLDEIDVYIETDDMDPILVAHGGPFEAGETRIELETTGVDISNYLRSDEITVSTRAKGKLPRQEMDIAAKAVFTVDVNVMQVACDR
jgi:hypothetical protein